MKIDHFQPISEIPFYYACFFPLIHDKFRSMGSITYISLLANDQLYGLPALCSDHTVPLISVGRLLNYKSGMYTMKKRAFPTLEAGLAEIRESIQKQEIVLAIGITYHLHYSKDYRNPKFIESIVKTNNHVTDHYLTVYGLGDDCVYIQDPVPHDFMGPLSMGEFIDFWKGSKGIPEFANINGIERFLEYSILDVKIDEPIDEERVKEYFLATLKATSQLYLADQVLKKDNQTYYFGKLSATVLQDWINQGINNGDRKSLPKLNKCIFDMRWSRYYFNDMLKDMARILGEPYGTTAHKLAEISKGWENLHKLFQVKLLRPKYKVEDLDSFNTILTDLIERETRLHEQLLAETETGPLEKKIVI